MDIDIIGEIVYKRNREHDWRHWDMSEKTITDGLFALKDENYRRFHAKLIPDIPIDNIIGVRTPVLRKYAKEIYF